MAGVWDSDEARRLRAFELISGTDSPVIPVSDSVLRVHSQSGRGYYTVRKTAKGWVCDCASFEAGASKTGFVPCKHAWVAKIWFAPTEYVQPGATAGPKRPTYSQNWPAYDAAQQDEHLLFDPLLWSLVEHIPEPLRAVGRGGRPPIPRSTQLLVSVKKVHLGMSMRRAKGLIEALNQAGGILPEVPNYAVPSRFFNSPDAGAVLLDLIRESARPLRELEAGGTVAIDSTGFCTTCMGAYCTEKHDPSRKHRWVKAHVIVGVRTHVILDVRVTDENGADCPQFVPLLNGVKAAGFTPATVVADKAYLSMQNYAAATDLGMNAYIPFKVNSVSNEVHRLRGIHTPPSWDKAYHLFQLKRDDFNAPYHQRSNVEAVFGAIKRKLGEALLSRTQHARFNELLAKLLAYNIGIIVHEIHEHGIDPAELGLKSPPVTPSDEGNPVGEQQTICDGSPPAVTQMGEALD